MSTIQIQVSDKTLARYGTQALIERLERLLAWEELSVEAQEIKKSLNDANISLEEISEEVRQRAWDKYKYTIEDKLPPEAFE
ncbi:hypothetical protein [Spirosoma validum]|uniref:Uncharacterized protein n=1 Tax=Spirosoma validum TaxID=2771355 RepID=A0A927B673_9BACT|nr:hypothetical protein [Spirosoma validum]MBD2756411.1 hypothetical protein [Spirosoma validum]